MTTTDDIARAALLGTALLLLVPTAADAQEDPDREALEAEMFGAPEEVPGTADEPEDADEPDDQDESSQREALEADMFGGPEEVPGTAEQPAAARLVAARIEDKIVAQDERFAIGGSTFHQLQYTVFDDGDPLDFPLLQTNILDLYVDARPTDRLRVFAEGRLNYTPTTAGGTTGAFTQVDAGPDSADQVDVELDEFWLKFDAERAVYVTVGRQHVRWGVGRMWYPNDFLYPTRKDPLAVFDRRTGLDLVRAHVPLPDLGTNLYAVANLTGASSPGDVGGAMRAETLVDLTELGLAVAARDGEPIRIGADVSTGIGWFDVYAALSVLHDVDDPFFRGETNLSEFDEITLQNAAQLQPPEIFYREDDWIPRALVGFELGIPYGDDDTVYLGAEYFFNDAGVTDPELYPWLLLAGTLEPLYTGRHYAAASVILPSPGTWDDTSLSLSTLGNLSDRSFVSRLDYSVTVLTRLRAFVNLTGFWGDGELHRDFRLPAIDAQVLELAASQGGFEIPEDQVPEDGFPGAFIPARRFTIGTGVSLSF